MLLLRNSKIVFNYRQASTNGQNEKDTYTKTSPENKRIFLIPAADNVRVTRFPMGPRNY